MPRLPLSLLAALPLALLPARPVVAQAAQAAARAPQLLVLDKAAATARLLDPATGAAVATWPTGAGPHEVATSPDGRWAVVADYGAQQPGSTLTVLDVPGRTVARTISLGEHRRPHGLVWLPAARGAAPRVAVTVEQTQAVLVVDVAAGRVVHAIPTQERGTHMLALAPDGRHAYTANIGSGTVSMLDLTAGRLLKTVRTGVGPEAIDVSPDGREVWAADRQRAVVTVLDARTLDSLATMETGKFPNRLKFTPDGRWALVSNAESSTITVYDVRARRLAHTVAVPPDPARARQTVLGDRFAGSAVPLGILMAPDGRHAWVATAATGQLRELRIPAWTLGRTLDGGQEPDGMAWAR